MAKDFGQLLREKRESRYLSLPDVEIATRIRAEHLQALERGDLEALPGSTYAEIYLREYAHFLDLDAEALIAMLRQRMRWPRFRQRLAQRLRRLFHGRAPVLGVGAFLVVMLVVVLVWVFAGGGSSASGEKHLLLLYPPDGAALNGREVVVVGRVPPGASVAVNDQPVSVQPDGLFVQAVPVGPGRTELKFYAGDATGWHEEAVRTVWLPTPTPRPTLSLPASQTSGTPYQLILHQVDAVYHPDVIVYLSVLDASGNPWPGLTREHLSVQEDGSPIPNWLLRTVPLTEPLAIVLAVDTSGSMGSNNSEPLHQAQEALRTFLNELGEGDKGCLVAFSGQPELVQECTQDKGSLRAAVDKLAAGGETALYDAVAFALEQAIGQPTGRRVLIVLTDGHDTASRASLDEVIARAGMYNVPVYAVGLQSNEFDPAPLERLAAETGASYLFAPQADALGELYARLSRQLRGQYQLIYRSPAPSSPGSEHRVTLITRINGVENTSSKSYRIP
ncbi:MAG: VWA domain-containing protein [Chloroflexia bacterium]